MVNRSRAAADAPQGRALAARVKPADDSRDSFPGEHWLVLGAGLAVWTLTRKSPSFLVRTAGMLAGSALVGRAASGRDGLSRLVRWLPVGGRVR
ncbi:hypothetical protein [Hydrogenophaga laconesensis]|uniref:Uncharacterized protein n=1 Tax=Hydrogenophaga laconesensis TaxID=1805971 RepID=A0ABU1V5G6_9BURK|nr:hypothetical protein [Hydrogenophaga laconesensis]MDR7092687.1 hypothetical protein [Hydrogenophaga laconesensis]